jgi:hypothetical protein
MCMHGCVISVRYEHQIDSIDVSGDTCKLIQSFQETHVKLSLWTGGGQSTGASSSGQSTLNPPTCLPVFLHLLTIVTSTMPVEHQSTIDPLLRMY